MQLVKLGGDHTIDVGLLPESPVVLDVGARGFAFVRDILALRPKALVVAMEPDPDVQDPDIVGCEFIHKALVHHEDCVRKYAAFSTGEGNFLSDVDIHYASMKTVPCVSIYSVMEGLGIAHWDVVKLDCEGSEFDILRSWPGPIATQISVEFHDYQNRAKYDDAYFGDLFRGRLRDYKVVQHPLTGVGPGPSYGHWDSLLVLKS